MKYCLQFVGISYDDKLYNELDKAYEMGMFYLNAYTSRKGTYRTDNETFYYYDTADGIKGFKISVYWENADLPKKFQSMMGTYENSLYETDELKTLVGSLKSLYDLVPNPQYRKYGSHSTDGSFVISDGSRVETINKALYVELGLYLAKLGVI